MAPVARAKGRGSGLLVMGGGWSAAFAIGSRIIETLEAEPRPLKYIFASGISALTHCRCSDCTRLFKAQLVENRARRGAAFKMDTYFRCRTLRILPRGSPSCSSLHRSNHEGSGPKTQGRLLQELQSPLQTAVHNSSNRISPRHAKGMGVTSQAKVHTSSVYKPLLM